MLMCRGMHASLWMGMPNMLEMHLNEPLGRTAFRKPMFPCSGTNLSISRIA